LAAETVEICWNSRENTDDMVAVSNPAGSRAKRMNDEVWIFNLQGLGQCESTSNLLMDKTSGRPGSHWPASSGSVKFIERVRTSIFAALKMRRMNPVISIATSPSWVRTPALGLTIGARVAHYLAPDGSIVELIARGDLSAEGRSALEHDGVETKVILIDGAQLAGLTAFRPPSPPFPANPT
jgi:hypothetical protein